MTTHGLKAQIDQNIRNYELECIRENEAAARNFDMQQLVEHFTQLFLVSGEDSDGFDVSFEVGPHQTMFFIRPLFSTISQIREELENTDGSDWSDESDESDSNDSDGSDDRDDR